MKENEANKNGPSLDPEKIDEWLHQQLEPGPEQVNRVVRRALAEERTSPNSRTISWKAMAVVTAGFCLIAIISAVILGQFMHRQTQIPAPAGEEKSDIVATITNESGPVELRLQDSANAIMPSGGNKALPSEPSVQIFNEDGLVAAQVVDGGVSYLVIGGEK